MNPHALATALCAADWALCVGKGWQPIVGTVVVKILEMGGKIQQIKEKFGGLRLYWGGSAIPAAPDYVEMAEFACWHICEHCGTTQNVTTEDKGWILTLCRDCHDARTPRSEISPKNYPHCIKCFFCGQRPKRQFEFCDADIHLITQGADFNCGCEGIPPSIFLTKLRELKVKRVENVD